MSSPAPGWDGSMGERGAGTVGLQSGAAAAAEMT